MRTRTYHLILSAMAFCIAMLVSVKLNVWWLIALYWMLVGIKWGWNS